ncbi:MAG: hypothetical protein L0H79_00740 [Intrasporangium sp.]|nr:hypothetical protein [Intrasporangium sp.]
MPLSSLRADAHSRKLVASRDDLQHNLVNGTDGSAGAQIATHRSGNIM